MFVSNECKMTSIVDFIRTSLGIDEVGNCGFSANDS